MSEIISIFIQGLLFGITVAMIPGPIFFLIIQRTLSEGLAVGIACALGSVTADVTYALIAAIGLTWISHALLAYQTVIVLLGALFLIYLGITTFMRQPVLYNTVVGPSKKSLLKAWFSTLLLTLASPVTIVSYTVMFAGLGVGAGTFSSALVLIMGVVIGALMVEFALLGFVRIFHHRLSMSAINLINKTAGTLLISFGLLAIARSLALF